MYDKQLNDGFHIQGLGGQAQGRAPPTSAGRGRSRGARRGGGTGGRNRSSTGRDDGQPLGPGQGTLAAVSNSNVTGMPADSKKFV